MKLTPYVFVDHQVCVRYRSQTYNVVQERNQRSFFMEITLICIADNNQYKHLKYMVLQKKNKTEKGIGNIT